MKLINKISLLLLTVSSLVSAQELTTNDTVPKKETNISFLDSIKKTFVRDEMAECVDSLWMNELSVLNQYDEISSDIANIDINEKVDYELPTELLKQRLKEMDEKSPFHIEYNEGLENVIKSYLKNRKKGFERLMGITQYYFPIFEEALAKYNIPLEIKYLAVVESALKPKVVSRAGATGLWQFMYETGKQYGLKINSYVDERSNDLKASDAAARYMQKSFEVFGDWELVLASYNSGAGNVTKAIRRSGGHQNFWNIRKYLPKETQGYVPAFLATMYIFEYHKEHGIVPDKAIANHFATDTIAVKEQITFKQLSELLDMPVAELEYFNPSYKRNEVPHITGETYFLRLPKSKIAIFASNEDKIYAYANHQRNLREKPFEKSERIALNKNEDSNNEEKEFVTRTKFHKVRRGENLAEISNKYGVSVSEIKKWNALRGNKVSLGRKLKIVTTERIAYKHKENKEKQNEDIAYQAKQISEPKQEKIAEPKSEKLAEPKYEKTYVTEKVFVNKDVTKMHKVKKGDNLGEIAEKYDVSIAEIKKWNHLRSNNVALGKSLKIIKNERVATNVRKEVRKPIYAKNEDVAYTGKTNNIDSLEKNVTYYTVEKGDNLSSIAKKNNTTVEELKKWNNIEDNKVQLKSKLKIASIENNEADETDEYGVFKTEIKTTEYTVKKGDNLASIAKKNGVTISELKEWNNVLDNNLKANTKLIVSKKLVLSKNKGENNNEDRIASVKTSKNKANDAKSKEKLYYVKKGDSLFSIAKKYPGITVSDIKKWNGIKGNDLKPGMKLKIIG